jgi:hypothetical protein
MAILLTRNILFQCFFFAQAKTDQQEEYPTDRGDEKKV